MSNVNTLLSIKSQLCSLRIDYDRALSMPTWGANAKFDIIRNLTRIRETLRNISSQISSINSDSLSADEMKLYNDIMNLYKELDTYQDRK
jgi:hypothetical protein